jgi:hypothetical protein
MSTITFPAPAATSSRRPCPDIPAEQRIAIRHIPWDIYDRLSDAIGEGQNIHLAYDGKDLEVMVVGREHEDFKDLFSRFINAITDDLHMPSRSRVKPRGSAPKSCGGWKATCAITFAPTRSHRTEKRGNSARGLWRTIPTPTWPSKSTCHRRRSTNRASTRRSKSPRSGNSTGLRW